MVLEFGEYLEKFEGTIDPKNPFSGQSPRTDGLLDEVWMELGIKEHILSARLLLVMKFFWF